MMNKKMNNYGMEEIMPILAQQVRKYTSNDSTSVHFDKARQVMDSIMYCIKGYEPEKDGEIMSKTPATKAFEIGLQNRKEKIKKAKELYEEILKSFCHYDNECYYDTIIKGIPAFFERYDVEFDAKNNIITLDYPLICIASNTVGIDLIYDYLEKVKLEQEFLHKFSEDTIKSILRGYHENHSGLIMNICKPVLRNAIGCVLLKKPIRTLSINRVEVEEINEMVKKLSIKKLGELLATAILEMVDKDLDHNSDLTDYFVYDLKEFTNQIRSYFKLNKLHLVFLEGKEETFKVETKFEDGVSMDDEKLRNIIDEMKEMRYVSDKVALIKEKVKSLADLKEILKECFFSQEFEEVFNLLSAEEIKLLQKEVSEKKEYENDLDDWEVAISKINFK